MTRDDWPAVRRIHEEGIETGDATFDAEAPDWEEWDASHLDAPRLVATDGDEVVGWAALLPTSRRPVYRGRVETSIYIAASARGGGVGRRLLEALIDHTEAAGIWTLEALVFPENGASIALLERAGFRVVGTRERLGQMHGRWRDVVLLERRSRT